MFFVISEVWLALAGREASTPAKKQCHPRRCPGGPSAYVKAMAKQGHQNEPNKKIDKVYYLCHNYKKQREQNERNTTDFF